MARTQRLADLQSSERAYVTGRLAYTLLIFLLYIYWTSVINPDEPSPTFAAALALLVVTGFLVVIGIMATRVSVTGLVWAALPADLAATLLLTISFHNNDDPAFGVVMALPVVYATLVRKRLVWLVAGSCSIIYMAGHALAPAQHELADWFLLALKASSVVFVAFIVSDAFARLMQRESELELTSERTGSLNAELKRRITELHAISEISELIHSSLDFDRVGPLVMDILMKVIDLPFAHLFVVDKLRAETLFTASSAGASAVPSVSVYAAGGAYGIEHETSGVDGHVSCMPVLNHEQLMVVFCADSGRIEGLSDDDRLVLQAVAGELAVAVENSRLYKLTRTLAITDELTNLHNYRFLQQRIDEEMERSRRYEKHLSLLMLDVDDFKGFNDAQGHIAGDAALTELGEVLLRCVREVDVVSRYGGEEFAVVLPETDAAGTFVVAEKIRDAVSRHAFPDAEGMKRVHMTVSIGFSTFPLHAHDKEALLKQADDALYQAKHSGKDRVRSPRSRLTLLGGGGEDEGARADRDGVAGTSGAGGTG